MNKLDPRLNAFRPDVADARLEGRVEARRFVEGRRMQVGEPLISIRKAPRFDAMQLTQALMGETVLVFAEAEGWAFVQLERDGYVGYTVSDALSREINAATHRVAVPSSFLFPVPDIKAQPAVTVTLNALVTAVAADGKFTRLATGGFMFTSHLGGLEEREADFVAIAGQFRHVPYYWGGKSVRGIDCSGLVQLALEASGRRALRDSDMQENTLGEKLPETGIDSLRRGDLVFWKGHVGIMTGAQTLLHANGHHMMVVEEPLRDAQARIAISGGQITSIRRLQ